MSRVLAELCRYNEAACLQAIEKRLGAAVESIRPIPDATQPHMYRFELPAWAASLSYGEDRVGPQETSEHIAAIATRVEVWCCFVGRPSLLGVRLPPSWPFLSVSAACCMWSPARGPCPWPLRAAVAIDSCVADAGGAGTQVPAFLP
jgi:hypothetical protein